MSTSHVSRIHVQGVNPSFLGIIADANVGGGTLNGFSTDVRTQGGGSQIAVSSLDSMGNEGPLCLGLASLFFEAVVLYIDNDSLVCQVAARKARPSQKL